MSDLISREATISDIRSRYCAECNNYNGVRCRACWVDDMIDEFDCAPAVDAEPVRHGRWDVRVEVQGDSYDDALWEVIIAQCSECGREAYLDEYECAHGGVQKELAKYPYCHCGAKMDGGKKR